ncbi:hypothetical protein [Pedobacter cryoconitis]|uniref:Outer membrane beta-barrel protein n=1 Tax=Pedobacter cryoconitis TaxID=188932 RepID=A0A7X0IYR5_9SPHI|nr:hypothetical protein [Pedobacter cryoconitis]MBB6497909.1 hypothetical protein [Pedobacter cryoconitis]
MKILFVLLFFQIAVSANAQDSLMKSKTIPESYPALKYVTIQKDYFGDSDYHLYSKGNDSQQEGEFSGNRLRINVLVPVYSKQRLSLSAGMVYTRESVSYYRKTTNESYGKGEFAKNDFDALFSAKYRGVLWNKPFVLGGTVILGSTDFFDVKKLSGLVSAFLVLKANANTISSVGIFANLDKAAIFPAFPVYTYWHRVPGTFWEIDMILPQKIIFRRSGVLNGWVSAGAELVNSSFFLKQNAEGAYSAGNYEWVSNEINSYIGYEHLLGKNFLLGIKGGHRNSVTTRLTRVNENSNNYKSRTNISSSFLSMNLSYVIPNNKTKKTVPTKNKL